MKMYSSDSVTKDYVDNAITQAVQSTARTTTEAVTGLDKKQNDELRFFKKLLIASFAFNFLVAIGAYFF